MTENQEQKWEDVTLKSLEAEVRSLGEVEAPETLKRKLFAQIPNSKPGCEREHQVRWRSGVLGFAAAVAAVVILALIFVPNYVPSMPSQRVIAEINDRPTHSSPAEESNALIKDINYADCNGQ